MVSQKNKCGVLLCSIAHLVRLNELVSIILM